VERDVQSTYAYLEKRFGLKKEDIEKRWKKWHKMKILSPHSETYKELWFI
jgi:hypothetical protein